MFTFFTLLVAFAALGLAAWLRERVVRLENEVRRLSAPSRTSSPASSSRSRAGRATSSGSASS